MKPFVVVSLALIILLAIVTFVPPPQLANAAPQWQTYAPPAWILGPIQGADGNETTVLKTLDHIIENDIPITVFHFDAPDWQTCIGNAQFRYSDEVLNRLRENHIRALFWLVPLIDMSCPEYQDALAHDYFVRDGEGTVIVTNNFVGYGSWLDFDNPDAVASWHSQLDSLLARTGDVIGGFYTDSVRPDLTGGSGRPYGEAYSLDLLNYTRDHIPDGDVVMKRYGRNTPSDEFMTQHAHVSYVNDLSTDFKGMITGIKRVFNTTKFMPLPFNEFSGYAKKAPDAETYIRRMHFGAFQPVMENVPLPNANPWDHPYPPQVLEAYSYYATLHRELAPYIHSYDQQAFDDQTPILRDFDKKRLSTRLGNEIFVQYVTDYVTQVSTRLPAGEWINYWDESQSYQGPGKITLDAPLGREPILIARGAIIPMWVRNNVTGHGTRQSDGSLTVNVYPDVTSSFRYHDFAQGWLTLYAKKKQNRLALCTLDAAPSQPIIYRIEQWQAKPSAVRAKNGAVGIDTEWGRKLDKRENEAAVNGSASGWYYDAAAQRLIVKISELGTDCLAP